MNERRQPGQRIFNEKGGCSHLAAIGTLAPLWQWPAFWPNRDASLPRVEDPPDCVRLSLGLRCASGFTAIVAKERRADLLRDGAIFVNRVIENRAHAATFAPGS